MLVVYCFCLAIFFGEFAFSILSNKGNKGQVSDTNFVLRFISFKNIIVQVQINDQDVWK